MKIRPLAIAVALVALQLLSRPASASTSTGVFHITAKTIAFYSNRYIVTADGDVHVTLADGTDLRGNTFAMDLRLNRFVIAGNVALTAAQTKYAGAAFAEYFDFDRGYFVPVGDEPDRWTFTAGDYKNILRGREMPGDTFFLPDLSRDRVFLYAKSATIDPRNSVRFAPADLNFGISFVTFPTYFLNFSPNPNFAQNSLTGAQVDGPLDFAGGAHSLETLHVRYDALDKAYLAYEQHLVSANSYVVASVNPLTRPQKDYNLFAYARLSPKLNVEGNFQAFTFQHGFSRPLSAGGYANFRATLGLGHGFLQLNADQYYDSFLAQPAPGLNGLLYYGDPSHNWVPNHANDASITGTLIPHQIRLFPVNFRFRGSFGLAHDGLSPPVSLSAAGGVPNLDGSTSYVNYPTVWNHSFGATAYTNPLLLYRKGAQSLSFSGIFDRQLQYFSFPHHIDTASTTLTLTDTYGSKFAAFLGYQIVNTRDIYSTAQLQNEIYPSYAPTSPLTGITYTDYAAFTGKATTRALTESIIYTPSTFFTGSLTVREDNDFPKAIPYPSGYLGIATNYEQRLLGLSNALTSVGLPPAQATADVRFRITPTITLDFSKSYYFNYGGYYRWSNGFALQVLK